MTPLGLVCAAPHPLPNSDHPRPCKLDSALKVTNTLAFLGKGERLVGDTLAHYKGRISGEISSTKGGRTERLAARDPARVTPGANSFIQPVESQWEAGGNVGLL